jgi:hypothetical protein
VGFSIKTAVLVLVFGAVVAGAFALHRLQPQVRKNCDYTNWSAPCYHSGWHVDWADVTAGAAALVASVGSGLIVGTRQKKKKKTRKMSSTAPRSQRA